jgi:hypothetical protein
MQVVEEVEDLHHKEDQQVQVDLVEVEQEVQDRVEQLQQDQPTLVEVVEVVQQLVEQVVQADRE